MVLLAVALTLFLPSFTLKILRGQDSPSPFLKRYPFTNACL